MNGKKIAIVVMAGVLIFSLEPLIAQRSMVFEVGATPLLCRVLRSNRCNSKNLRMALKSLPCVLFTGKSLMWLAIVAKNPFRASNGP
jgi:hypothetical protein